MKCVTMYRWTILFCNVRQRSTKAIVLATRSGRLGAPVAAALATATFQVELCNNRLLLVSLCKRVCFLFAALR